MFTITSLKVEQPVYNIQCMVIDPAWSWTTPDGRIVKWNQERGDMDNATYKDKFIGVDEDGEDIIEYYWTVSDFAGECRIPDPPLIPGVKKIAGQESIIGSYTMLINDQNQSKKYYDEHEKFDAEHNGRKVIGIMITSLSYNGGVAQGQFIADKIIPERPIS